MVGAALEPPSVGHPPVGRLQAAPTCSPLVRYPMGDIFDAIDFLKESAEPALRRFVRTHRGASYAEMRFEAMFSRAAVANDGEPRDSSESEAAAFGLTVHYAAAEDVVGHGQ